MFKKKPDIPPRPKIPTIEQIIEDIQHSSPDDNLFQKPSAAQELKDDVTARLSDSEIVYNKVKEFVEVNACLREICQKLKDQNEALKISVLELKAMADDIRKQALDPLQ